MRSTAPLFFVFCLLFLTGCPEVPPNSPLTLGGDARLVGTWEGTTVILGHTVDSHVTYDSSGNYRTFNYVQTDGSSYSSAGRWYTDQDKGWYDNVRTSGSINNADTVGIFRGLYEANGDTLEEWNNPIDMDRPSSTSSAGTYIQYTRVQTKEAINYSDYPHKRGLADELLLNK